MPERIPTIWSNIARGDYVEDKSGKVWKVIRETTKPEGRYLGIIDGAKRTHIIGPDLSGDVIRLEYGTLLTEEQVIEAVGGKVLVEQIGPTYVHPPHSAFEADAGLLRAHLVRFHGAGNPPERFEDAVLTHRADHNDGKADHTHNEGD